MPSRKHVLSKPWFWGLAIPSLCIICVLAGNDIPLVLLGAPGFLAAIMVLWWGPRPVSLSQQLVGVLVYMVVNGFLWAGVVVLLRWLGRRHSSTRLAGATLHMSVLPATGPEIVGHRHCARARHRKLGPSR